MTNEISIFLNKYSALWLKILIPILGLLFFTFVGIVKKIIGSSQGFKLFSDIMSHPLFYELAQYINYGNNPEELFSLSELNEKKKKLLKKVIRSEAKLIYDYMITIVTENKMTYNSKNILSTETTEVFNNKAVTPIEAMIRDMIAFTDTKIIQQDVPLKYVDLFNKNYGYDSINNLIDEIKMILALDYTKYQKYESILNLIKKNFIMIRVDIRIKMTHILNGELDKLL